MITIVSGLPRSGTSLMMQMLAAGGMPVLTDGQPPPDVNNPKGYFEWSGVQQLRERPISILDAQGKAVKIISFMLQWVPFGPECQIIFMRRPTEETVASQKAMLLAKGKVPALADDEMALALDVHLRETVKFFECRWSHYFCNYHNVLENPEQESRSISMFCFPGQLLDWKAMAACVDRSLYRQRQAFRNLPATSSLGA